MSKRAYSCHVLSRYICYGVIGMSAPSLHRESTDPTMNTQHQSCVYVRSNEITVVTHTFSRHKHIDQCAHELALHPTQWYSKST